VLDAFEDLGCWRRHLHIRCKAAFDTTMLRAVTADQGIYLGMPHHPLSRIPDLTSTSDIMVISR